MKSIFKKDRFRHLKFCSKRNIVSFISISILCSSTSFGQSKIDSLTTEINKTNSLAQKAPLYLKRALLYTKNDRDKAFNDVDLAIKYYTEKNNKIGEVDSYSAYGNLHLLYGEPLRAAHFDSLAIQLANEISYEKGSAKAIGDLAGDFVYLGDLDKGEKLFKEAIEMEKNFRPQDSTTLARLHNRYYMLHESRGNHIKGLVLIEKAMGYSKNSKDTDLLLQIYNNYAIALFHLSRYDEAANVYFKVIQTCEKKNNIRGMARVYNNIGFVFESGLEYDKAITYYKKSLEFSKKIKDYRVMGHAAVNLAAVYGWEGQYKAADTLFVQGIHYFEMASNKNGLAVGYHSYGDYLCSQKNYSKADAYLLKALELRNQIGAMPDVASTLSVLGKSSIAQKKWAKAEKYLLEAETIFNESKQTDVNLKVLYGYLKQLYYEKGNFEKAYEYQSKELELEKTLFTESEKVNTLKAEAAYEMEKQDIEMALEREKQQRNKQLMLFISAGVVGLLLFTLLIFWLRRRQLKERHKASIQNLTNEHRLKVSKALKTAEQQERKKIAHKLHDESGSMLSIAILNVNQLQDDIFKAGGSSEEKLETTKKLLKDISDSVRNISHTLMPVVLEKHGIKPAIQELVNSVNTSKKIKIEEIIEGLEDTHSWSEEFCLTIYRIVQEVVNNIIKHAQATHVLLQVVELEDSVTIYIEDNGKGLDESNSTDGIGLKTLKNNVAYLNGTIEINGNLNKGTFILAELPIEKTKNVKLPLP